MSNRRPHAASGGTVCAVIATTMMSLVAEAALSRRVASHPSTLGI
jgi:hypothetical protein